MISINLEPKLTFSELLAAFSILLHHNFLSSSVNELWELILQMSVPKDIVINFLFIYFVQALPPLYLNIRMLV